MTEMADKDQDWVYTGKGYVVWLGQVKYLIQKQEVELRKTPKTAFLSIF